MSDEISIEAGDPKARLARKKMWTRRLVVVIASAILTLVACMFLGIRFGSADQVILTLLSIGMIVFLLRVFRSKGRFGFASLLLLTAFSAIVFRLVLQPLKLQFEQNAAIEQVNRNGGSVGTYGITDRYPEDAYGWVQTKSGYLYPALLAYLEQMYLTSVEVYDLKIPSSLVDKGTLQALRCEHVRGVEVLLDGSGDGKQFSDIIAHMPNLFPAWDHFRYCPLVFVANELRESDMEFLNGMRWGGVGRGMPVIKLGLDCRFEPKVLELLDVGFELIIQGTESDPIFLKRVIQVQNLKRINIHGWSNLKTALQSISKRSQPLETLQMKGVSFDAETWQLLCDSNNCRSIRIAGIHYQGPPMPSEILKQLGKNKSVKELVVYLDESQSSAIPSLMQMEGLKRLEVHCEARCDASLVSCIQDSTLEDVWLDMEPESSYTIGLDPWMDNLKSLRLGKKQLVTPK